MPSVNIENGKRIEDLMEISKFSDSAHFLVSEHNLTRKTSLTSLRFMFNGDTATDNLNNLYYSIEKLNELFGNVNDEFAKLTERLDTLNLKIQDIYTNLGANLDEFKNRLEAIYIELTQADEDIMAFIREQIRIEQEARIAADDALSERIDTEAGLREAGDEQLANDILDLSSTVEEYRSELIEKINNETTARENADADLWSAVNLNKESIYALMDDVDTINTSLTSLTNRVTILENKITISPNAPGSSLETGKIWLQYF